MAETSLFIHCGTHKTATSAFQNICSRNEPELLRAGVLYPKIVKKAYGKEFVNPQHSIIARSLSSKNPALAINFFKFAKAKIEEKNFHTALISGEDFENILIDYSLLERLISISRKAGFKAPTLAFVTRDPFEYLRSIYSELSKKNALLDFREAALCAAKTGFFSCPTPDSFGEGQTFNNFFAIDAKGLIKRFRSRFPELEIIHEPFESFASPWPGYHFLSSIMNPKLLKEIDFSKSRYNENARLSDMQVEINYTRTFIGPQYMKLGHISEAVSLVRYKARKKSEPFIKKLFQESFE